MELKSFFSKWTQIAGLFLMGGALAWAAKLCIIIATNGRIIDSGAAAILMTMGLVMLLIGSTGIGNRLSLNRTPLLRTTAIILSPVLLIGSFLLFALIMRPVVNTILDNTSVWYAQQEAPIALAVIFHLLIGGLLYRSYKSISL